MGRWINLQAEGWHAADEHLHYERTDPRHDNDWLTMLDADGLSHAHFLVLRGGNLPGIWAQQFAYGKAGEATDGKRLIRPGEEYRDYPFQPGPEDLETIRGEMNLEEVRRRVHSS